MPIEKYRLRDGSIVDRRSEDGAFWNNDYQAWYNPDGSLAPMDIRAETEKRAKQEQRLTDEISRTGPFAKGSMAGKAVELLSPFLFPGAGIFTAATRTGLGYSADSSDVMNETLNYARTGPKSFLGGITSGISQIVGIGEAATGSESLGNVRRSINNAGEELNINSLIGDAAARYEADRGNKKMAFVQKVGAAIGPGMGSTIPGMAIGGAIGGLAGGAALARGASTAAAESIGSLASYASEALQEGGGAYGELYDELKARGYSNAQARSEALTAFGKTAAANVMWLQGKDYIGRKYFGITDNSRKVMRELLKDEGGMDAAKAVIKNATESRFSKLKGVAKEIGKDFISEGFLEEQVQEAISSLAKSGKPATLENIYKAYTSDEALLEGIVGGITGALIGRTMSGGEGSAAGQGDVKSGPNGPAAQAPPSTGTMSPPATAKPEEVVKVHAGEDGTPVVEIGGTKWSWDKDRRAPVGIDQNGQVVTWDPAYDPDSAVLKALQGAIEAGVGGVQQTPVPPTAPAAPVTTPTPVQPPAAPAGGNFFQTQPGSTSMGNEHGQTIQVGQMSPGGLPMAGVLEVGQAQVPWDQTRRAFVQKSQEQQTEAQAPAAPSIPAATSPAPSTDPTAIQAPPVQYGTRPDGFHPITSEPTRPAWLAPDNGGPRDAVWQVRLEQRQELAANLDRAINNMVEQAQNPDGPKAARYQAKVDRARAALLEFDQRFLADPKDTPTGFVQPGTKPAAAPTPAAPRQTVATPAQLSPEERTAFEAEHSRLTSRMEQARAALEQAKANLEPVIAGLQEQAKAKATEVVAAGKNGSATAESLAKDILSKIPEYRRATAEISRLQNAYNQVALDTTTGYELLSKKYGVHEVGVKGYAQPEAKPAPAQEPAPAPAPQTSDRRSESTPVSTEQRSGDRRTQGDLRKKVSEMTPEEMATALLTSSLMPLPSNRAFKDAPKTAHVAFADLDNFKDVNTIVGHDGGDALLHEVGQVLADLTTTFNEGKPAEKRVQPYHKSGDEILVTSDSAESLEEFLSTAREKIKNTTFNIKDTAGNTRTFSPGVSYGIGTDPKSAEDQSNLDKEARRQAGLRHNRDDGGSPSAPQVPAELPRDRGGREVLSQPEPAGEVASAPRAQSAWRPNDSTPWGKLAAAFFDQLFARHSITVADITRIAKENGMEGELHTHLRDALEAAVNSYILRRGIFSDDYASSDAIEMAQNILDSIPTQTTRDLDKIQGQQFSTPPAYAYVAAIPLDLKPGMVVLEPSAGTGNLATVAVAKGAEVHANEIDARRAGLLEATLGVTPTRKDAGQLRSLLPDLRPDAVLMNPPFSANVKTGGSDNMTGANHIAQAVRMLRPGGMLVAIVGGGISKPGELKGGMRFDSVTYGPWFDEMSKSVDILANIWVPGDVYTKQGTSFATRVLVMQKTNGGNQNYKATAKQAEVANLRELADILDGVRYDLRRRDAQAEQQSDGKGVSETPGRGLESGAPQETVQPGPVSDGRGTPGVNPPSVGQGNQTGTTSDGGTESVQPGKPVTGLPADGRTGGVQQTPGRGGSTQKGQVDSGNPGGQPVAKKAWKDMTPAEREAALMAELMGDDTTPSPAPPPATLTRSTAPAPAPQDNRNTIRPARPDEIPATLPKAEDAPVQMKTLTSGVGRKYVSRFGVIHGTPRLTVGDRGPLKAVTKVITLADGRDLMITAPVTAKNLADAMNAQVELGRLVSEGWFLKSSEEVDGLVMEAMRLNGELDDAIQEAVWANRDVKGADHESMREALEHRKFVANELSKAVGKFLEANNAAVRAYQKEIGTNQDENGDPVDLDQPEDKIRNALNDLLKSFGQPPSEDGMVMMQGGNLITKAQFESAVKLVLAITEHGIKEFKAAVQKISEMAGNLVEGVRIAIERAWDAALRMGAEIIDRAGMTWDQAVAKTAEILNKQDSVINIGDGTFAPYTVERVIFPGAKAHPAALVQTSAMAAARLPELADPKLNIPQELIESGAFSAPQLEAAVYAVNAMDKVSPDGKGGGFLIGDGTGVGKTREILAVLMHYQNSGQKRGVIFSANKGLINDLKRDAAAVGMDPDLFRVPPKSGVAIEGDGFIFMPYSTLANARSNKLMPDYGSPANIAFQTARISQVLHWLGPDFDGAMVFDEAHRAGKTVNISFNARRGSGFSGGTVEATDNGRAVGSLMTFLPKARVLAASATIATEPTNLGILERMGIWGDGAPFADYQEFLNVVGANGLGAMEMVARGLKQRGRYIARSLSMEGVSLSTVEHSITQDQTEIMDKCSDAWRIVANAFEDALAQSGMGQNRRASSRAKSMLYGSMQRFYNTLLTSVMLPTLFKQVDEDLADGKSVVIQFTQTNAAAEERAVNKRALENAETGDEDLDPIDASPRADLLNMIDKYFPTQLYEPVQSGVDANGRPIITYNPVTDENGSPVEDPDLVERKKELMLELANLTVPDAAINQIYEKYGEKAIAEVTGRKSRLEGNKQVPVNNRAADEFQNGGKRILLFSTAGGTGSSYHAGAEFKNQQQRVHYILQPGWEAAVAVQGSGRTNRASQVIAPIIKLMTTDIRGHKRFVSTIARRIEQLGALTQGERQSATKGLFNPADNLESTEAAQALRAFVESIFNGDASSISLNDFEDFTKIRLQVYDRSGNPTGQMVGEDSLPTIQRFMNRLMAMPVSYQNAVFDEYFGLVEEVVSQAEKNGTLDVGTRDLESDNVEIVSKYEIPNYPSANFIELRVEKKNKPIPFERVVSRQDLLGFYKRSDGITAAVTSKEIVGVDTGGKKTLYVFRYPNGDMVNSTNASPEKLGWTKHEDMTSAVHGWEESLPLLPASDFQRMFMVNGDILPLISNILGVAGSLDIRKSNTNQNEPILGAKFHLSEGRDVAEALGVELSSDNRPVRLNPFNLRKLVDANGLNQSIALKPNAPGKGITIRKERYQNQDRMRIVYSDALKNLQDIRAFANKYGLQAETRSGKNTVNLWLPIGDFGETHALYRLLEDYHVRRSPEIQDLMDANGVKEEADAPITRNPILDMKDPDQAFRALTREPVSLGGYQFRHGSTTDPEVYINGQWNEVSMKEFSNLWRDAQDRQNSGEMRLYAGLDLRLVLGHVVQMFNLDQKSRELMAITKATQVGFNHSWLTKALDLPSRLAQRYPETFGFVYESLKKRHHATNVFESTHVPAVVEAFKNIAKADREKLMEAMVEWRFKENPEAKAAYEAETRQEVEDLRKEAEAAEKVGNKLRASRLQARAQTKEDYANDIANGRRVVRGVRMTEADLTAQGFGPEAINAYKVYLDSFKEQITTLADSAETQAYLSNIEYLMEAEQLEQDLANAKNQEEHNKIKNRIDWLNNRYEIARRTADYYRSLLKTDLAYVPLIRNGDSVIQFWKEEEDEDGNMTRSLAAQVHGVTPFEAMKKANELVAKSSELREEGIYRTAPENWETVVQKTAKGSGLMNDLLQAAHHSDQNPKVAMAIMDALADLQMESIFSGSFKQHLKRARGILGFEYDPIMAHARYTIAAGKYNAHLKYSREINGRMDELEAHGATYRDTINYLKKLDEEMVANPVSPWTAMAMNMAAGAGLGANPAFMIQQMIQKLTHEAPTFFAIYGRDVATPYIRTARSIATDLAVAGKKATPELIDKLVTQEKFSSLSNDPAEREKMAVEVRDLLKRAEKEGIFMDSIHAETTQLAHGRDSELAKTAKEKYKTLEKFVFGMAAWTEKHNRRQTYIGQYLLARNVGFPVAEGINPQLDYDKIGRATGKEMTKLNPRASEVLAGKQVDWIHNRRGQTNRSNFQRSGFLGMFTSMFRYFTIEYAQQMRQIGKDAYDRAIAQGKSKEVARAAAVRPVLHSLKWALLMAGMAGIPFLEGILDLLWILLNEVAFPMLPAGVMRKPLKYWKTSINEALRGAGVPEPTREFLMRGAPALAGVSLERSVGMGDPLMLDRGKGVWNNLVNVVGGAPVGMGRRMVEQGSRLFQQGKPLSALSMLVRGAGNLGQSYRGESYLGGGEHRPSTPLERGLRAFGVTGLSEAKDRETMAQVEDERQNRAVASDKYLTAFTDAAVEARRNPSPDAYAKANRAISDISEYNRDVVRAGRHREVISREQISSSISRGSRTPEKNKAFMQIRAEQQRR